MTKVVGRSQRSMEPVPFVTLYQFVREQLEARGGRCTRASLLSVIEDNPAALAKLRQSQGFDALLGNMKHSGFIDLEGDMVHRTARQVGRRR